MHWTIKVKLGLNLNSIEKLSSRDRKKCIFSLMSTAVFLCYYTPKMSKILFNASICCIIPRLLLQNIMLLQSYSW